MSEIDKLKSELVGEHMTTIAQSDNVIITGIISIDRWHGQSIGYRVEDVNTNRQQYTRSLTEALGMSEDIINRS